MKTVVMELCSVIAQFGVMFFGDSVAKEVVVGWRRLWGGRCGFDGVCCMRVAQHIQ